MQSLVPGRARRLAKDQRRKVKFHETSGGATSARRMSLWKVRMEP
jgi:hypothetical protein